jgi:hypothetical protein
MTLLHWLLFWASGGGLVATSYPTFSFRTGRESWSRSFTTGTSSRSFRTGTWLRSFPE